MSSLDDAIKFINGRDKPLALYMFSTHSAAVKEVIDRTSSGSFVQNDCMMQVFSGALPLGGVGASGHGRYKGRWSYETFSHAKPVMLRNAGMEWLNDWSRNPPMSEGKYRFLSNVIFHSLPANPHQLQ